MYANEFQPRVGKSALTAGALKHGADSTSVANAVATVDESGKKWALALINLSPDHTLVCTVKLKDQPLEGTLPATVLAGDSPEMFNDMQHPARIVPEKKTFTFKQGVADLPPHSLVTLQIGLS